MALIDLTSHDEVALVRLTNGVTNPLSPILLDELSECLARVRRDCKGMVLAGGEKFFSIGMDLPTLVKLEPDAVNRFIDKFQQVIWELFSLPLPTASAVCGHAVAGGTILALMTDYRYLAGGKTVMGVNEVKLGLTVPYLPSLVLQQLLRDNDAKEMIYGGEFVGPEQASELGLVDGLCGKEACEQAALDKINSLAQLPAEALAALKEIRLESVINKYQAGRERELERFRELWFKPQTQELLAEAAKKF
jgi:enoyl-CoA hydratase/carnithine racemase